jgi:hypothetical protein
LVLLGLAGNRRDICRRRAPVQPGLEALERVGVAAGQHLDAPIWEIAGVAADAELLRLLGGGGAEEDPLNPSTDEAADAARTGPA